MEKLQGLHLSVEPGCIKIDQTKFIESCANRCRVLSSKGAQTPMDLKLDIGKSN